MQFSRSNGNTHTCIRKLSFDNDQDNEPALQGTAALILGTEILMPHINDVLMNAVNAIENKPELTCISEEGIADMDFLPNDLFDGFDFNMDENNDDDDVITSCNKVKYSISEMENGNASVTAVGDGKKKRGSLIRKHQISLLSTQVIPEISHEDDEKNGSILSNGHHVECNINKHLRNENNFAVPSMKFPISTNSTTTNRVISVHHIEEAAV